MSINDSFWPSWWIGFVVALVSAGIIGYFSKSIIAGGLSGFLISFFITGISIRRQYKIMRNEINNLIKEYTDQ